MSLKGIRFCAVAEEAEEMAEFFTRGLGLEERDLGGGEDFHGCVIPAGSDSWIEIWKMTENMPAGLMLQMVVDNADEMAKTAKASGLDVQGPMEAHGEKIYFAVAPGGLSISFQELVDDSG